MLRRDFLSYAGALSLSGLLPGCSRFSQASDVVLASASSDYIGNYYAVAVNLAGELLSKVQLPQRGHEVLALPHKPGHALVVARRPDRYLVEVDFNNSVISRQITSEPDTHFYGHACLSPDNQYLYTTENRFSDGRGVIVVRDLHNLQVLERFDSGGIGPHDIAFLPDGKTLAIGNGGIQTHPDYQRVKLNLDTMAPNLSYLDIGSGKLMASYHPQNHQLSMRHLDVREDGKVFIGVQYQGPEQDIVPLVYAHQGEDQLIAFDAPDEQWRSMHQYTSSVVVKDQKLFVTCPRGGYLKSWHADEHRFIASDSMSDVSGLCLLGQQLTASTGHGQLLKQAGKDYLASEVDGIRFDNHMTTLYSA
ncbi:DUF1513 domain-containing protein [Planctobacterium marinum]|uniref:DUF1513 domain-containing protein n=1 Tax=Planctobacterium marinum TaxID=1631968 RepID=UPI001E498EE2|nr:DUF1513 domain-containing protein [Planctobacterium marinum]MCC2607647.1 DUF1513 domain-containing protein [Planctobacterium marinum]